jgi:hypothetical protein
MSQLPRALRLGNDRVNECPLGVSEIAATGTCFNGVAPKPNRFNFRMPDNPPGTRSAASQWPVLGELRERW